MVGGMGVQSRVLFLGGRADVPELMAGSDLLALPSLFEGLPLSALEAMAAGLPVVGTRVCGTSEAISDGVTGRIVEPADPQALADAILEVLQQPGLAARLGAAGRLRVKQKFGAARMARETAAIYEELLQAPAGRDLEIAGYPALSAYQNM
jgi:glycosyltransferase involved in cell wall biosynthesis